MSDLDAFLADVGASQLGWPESLRFTYDTTRDLLARGVPGDLVECGVGAGCHPAVMARACIDAGETRTVRLFDSFEGVPHGGEHDTEWNAAHGDGSGRLEATGVAVCSADDVWRNIGRWLGDDFGQVSIGFHQGWFQDLVPRDAPLLGPIAFLRLDGDLYESTRVCLEHLWPLLSEGAVCVIDDLNLDGCQQAVRDYFGFMPEFQPITESGDGYVIASTVARIP